MTHLVEDLLLLARLDLDQAPNHQRVELRDSGRGCGRGLSGDRSGPSRNRRRILASSVINGDQEQLTQVVANLLANARAHTPPGTPIRNRRPRTRE